MSVKDYFTVKDEDGNVRDNFAYYGNPRRIKNEDELKKVTLESLGLTVERVKLELLGMDSDLILPDGTQYNDGFYEQMIEYAVGLTEKEFDIVVRPRKNVEALDFNRADFNSYMYVRTQQRPVIQVEEIELHFDNRRIIRYPDEWIKVTNRFGQIELQPTFMSQGISNLTIAQSMGMGMGFGNIFSNSYGIENRGNEFAPQMIGCTYYAGMLPIPEDERGVNRDWYIQPDLVAYIAKLSAIEVLERWGRLVLGAGIAGYSIAIDGISSTVNSTQSAENTASTADIDLIKKDMKQLHDALKSYYGFNMGVIS